MVHSNRILMLLENCSYPRDDRVRREARALEAAGFRVTVISPALAGQASCEVIDGVKVLRFPSPPVSKGSLGYIWEYLYTMTAIFYLSLHVFLRDGFDIVHAHQPPDTLAWIAGFYKLFGKKYVLDHHDLAPELYDAHFRGNGHAFFRRILVVTEKAACRLSDHIIATNQSYRRMEMERGEVPEAHITVVRNGPDLNEVYAAEPDPALRKDGKTVIGYVGAMGMQDGVDYLLRAIRHLVVDLGRRDLRCLLVGSGTAMPLLAPLSQELGISEFVSFVGWVEGTAEVRRYLNSMDVCVAPEPSDPYNEKSTAAKVMEYMAVAKPIVAFDLPEHRFSAGDAALYARPNDEMDFARQLERLIDSPELRKTLGEAGLNRIRSELSWQRQSGHLIGAYAALQRPGTGNRKSSHLESMARGGRTRR